MAAEQEVTRPRTGSFTQTKPKVLRPFNTAEVKVLLLENVNVTAVEAFKKQGYQVCCFFFLNSKNEMVD